MSTPSEHFCIIQDSTEREIFMSFGLLNEITSLLQDPATAASVYFTPELREKVILAALHQRTKTGKVEKPAAAIDDFDISLGDIEALLAWEVEHAIAFFARSMERVVAMKSTLESLQQDTSSLTGSQASASKKPSSGRSR